MVKWNLPPELAKEVIETCPSGIVVLGSGSEIRYFNAAARQALGIPVPSDGNSAPRLSDFLPGAIPESGAEHVLLLEAEGVRLDGEPLFVSGEIFRTGNVAESSVVAVFNDVTEKVQARKREELQLKLTDLLASRRELPDLLSTICETLCRMLGAAVVEAWLEKREGANELVLYASRHDDRPESLAFDAAGEKLRLKRGEGLAGHAWNIGNPLFFDDLDPLDSPMYLRRDEGRVAGLRAAIAVPMLHQGTSGALVLFFPKSSRAHPDLMRDLAAIGAQLAQCITRKRLEAEANVQQIRLINATQLAAVGQMAGNIAHEINNPLAIIQLLAGRLQEELQEGSRSDPRQLLGLAEQIESLVDRISLIVLGLRKVSRATDREDLNATELHRVFQDAFAVSTEKARSLGIELRFRPPPADLKVECRPVQLAQVFLNLMNNAFDAIQALEERWVAVETECVDLCVRIRITDSGRGIPPHVVSRLFEPYFTTKEAGKGTGIGLSLSKRLLEQQKGSLHLDTESPNTAFVITLKGCR